MRYSTFIGIVMAVVIVLIMLGEYNARGYFAFGTSTILLIVAPIIFYYYRKEERNE